MLFRAPSEASFARICSRRIRKAGALILQRFRDFRVPERKQDGSLFAVRTAQQAQSSAPVKPAESTLARSVSVESTRVKACISWAGMSSVSLFSKLSARDAIWS